MEGVYYRNYSSSLDRYMEVKRYGWGGKVGIYFPCQNGRFYDFENFGLNDLLSDYIDSGKLTVVSVDTVDEESLSDSGWRSYENRIARQEQYFNYIIRDLLAVLPEITGRSPENIGEMLTFGCSMGAYHAANLFFRRPDVFSRALCLSGVYSLRYIFGDFMAPLVYLNSPVDCIRGMSWNHPYIELYNRGRFIACVGRGAWEVPTLESTRELDSVLRSRGINAWVDYWGEDVTHDWYWWKKQTRYFLPFLLEDTLEGDPA
ncbi:MAG: esterase family protein [Lachnospiraceae bacterium]|jgi:esterase/lipase superfamily enzyme